MPLKRLPLSYTLSHPLPPTLTRAVDKPAEADVAQPGQRPEQRRMLRFRILECHGVQLRQALLPQQLAGKAAAVGIEIEVQPAQAACRQGWIPAVPLSQCACRAHPSSSPGGADASDKNCRPPARCFITRAAAAVNSSWLL